ncbi:SirB2 family protein [Methyloversatilis sp. XJ19-13]|uniref:SirB2 family protein n=1 Tax=Methyloversatilis sp. XJ19-13 TaxID=2963430 RepID=UPI00211BEAF8|nr:SirB2 family protein [Methyloversatilis sp. XJ19-13]MCQ9372666.1 SirB2 family protein [Methyloversatilis sp. XJ19-13]
MNLIDLYPLARQVHIGLVIASGSLFALRGIGVLSGARWSMRRSVRIASQIIDAGLLMAALSLLAMLQLNPFVVPWLATKLVLLVVYIVLGSLALKRARSARARFVCFIAALLTFAFMLGVARAHHPLGLLHGVL